MDKDTLAYIAQVAAIVAIMGAAFNFIVLRPLNVAIKMLQISVEKFRDAIEDSLKDRREISNRVTAVEESTKSAHRRIDDLKHDLIG